MADIRYNLDTIISKAIHRPILTKTGGLELPPLYARVGVESETEYMSEGTKNELWVKATQANYNSPTNVRRLFIGDSSVTIQYYQPPIINGKSSEKYWYNYKLDIDDPLNILAFKSKNYNRLVMSAAMVGQKAPQRIVLTGTGLAAISAHWKMSNIEEIFITPSILASESIENRFALAVGVLSHFIDMSNTGNESIGGSLKQAGDLALEIFNYTNCNNIKNIRARFPRLKTIGFVTNIDKIMDLVGAKSLNDGIPTTLGEINIKWVSNNKIANELPHLCSIGIADIPFTSSNYTDFSIRAGIYKFDNEVLEPYINRYRDRVLEIGRSTRDNATGANRVENKATIEKSKYEETLDILEKDKGKNAVSAILQLTFARSSKKEIDEVFNSMSSEGGQKYRKLLGR